MKNISDEIDSGRMNMLSSPLYTVVDTRVTYSAHDRVWIRAGATVMTRVRRAVTW